MVPGLRYWLHSTGNSTRYSRVFLESEQMPGGAEAVLHLKFNKSEVTNLGKNEMKHFHCFVAIPQDKHQVT